MKSLLDIKKIMPFPAKSGYRGFREWIVGSSPTMTRRWKIENVELLVKSMNDLQVELSGFRSEMKEFKKAVEKRMDVLDSRQFQCQVNPSSCANARRLEEHLKSDAGKSGRIMAVIACVISCFNVAVTLITLVARG